MAEKNKGEVGGRQGGRRDMRVHTLGCGSAKPTLRHQPSSTVLEHRGNLFMIDCGEGAQTALQRSRLKTNRLRHIFLTHLHGDHVFGLPGLLGTLDLSGNGGDLTIHTFEEGKRILGIIQDFFNRNGSLEVKFNVIRPEDAVILETPSLTVRTVKLRHRVPTVGYVFEEKPGPRHLNRAECDFRNVPISWFNRLKGGADYHSPSGLTIPNAELTFPPDSPRSYAHISDTAYMPELAGKIRGVDLLFHETTYLERNLSEAAPRGHSTARQAAMTARDAGAGALLTGHYSSRYSDDTEFLAEAREVFPNVILNREGLVTNIP